MSTNDRFENMITEAVETMDAAEETLDGEVIDQSADWIAHIKKHFSSLPPEQKKYAANLLRHGGYLPEEKMTATKMYELLADSLGPRSMEIGIVLHELA